MTPSRLAEAIPRLEASNGLATDVAARTPPQVSVLLLAVANAAGVTNENPLVEADS